MTVSTDATPQFTSGSRNAIVPRFGVIRHHVELRGGGCRRSLQRGALHEASKFRHDDPLTFVASFASIPTFYAT